MRGATGASPATTRARCSSSSAHTSRRLRHRHRRGTHRPRARRGRLPRRRPRLAGARALRRSRSRAGRRTRACSSATRRSCASGWGGGPRSAFDDLVSLMVDADLARLRPGRAIGSASMAVRRALVESLAAAAASRSLAACLVLEVWNADLRVPFDYSGDAAVHRRRRQERRRGRALWENDELGAPRGQELYDFPVFAGDNAQLAIVRALGFVVRDPIVALNLFFLLTFPLAALTAFLVLRRLGVRPPGALRRLRALRAAAVPLPARRGPPLPGGVLGRSARLLPRALRARRRAARHAAAQPAGAGDPRRLRDRRLGGRLLRRVHARPARGGRVLAGVARRSVGGRS